MADKTKIEWADATLNYVNGCSLESPGCTNCYAMKQAHRFPVRQGLTMKTKGGMVWTGEVRDNPPALEQAMRWRRGRKIFWNAHGDLFHPSVPDTWIDRQFAAFAMTPEHAHMVLTKRSARMREYFEEISSDPASRLANAAYTLGVDDDGCCAVANWINGFSRWRHAPADGNPLDGSVQRWPLPNVWLGVSVEDQKRADERREDFAATPAAVKFVSYEPALGPVDWRGWDFIDQIISGGESGPKARPTHPDWHRATRDFCHAHGIAYFFKQWGEWCPGESISPMHVMHRAETGAYWFNEEWSFETISPRIAEELHTDDEPDVWRVGKRNATRLIDGVEHNGVPAHG